eukprot:s3071_g9.t1
MAVLRRDQLLAARAGVVSGGLEAGQLPKARLMTSALQCPQPVLHAKPAGPEEDPTSVPEEQPHRPGQVLRKALAAAEQIDVEEVHTPRACKKKPFEATAMDYNTPEKCARPPKMAETLHPCGEVLLKPLNAHASEFFPSQPTADAESFFASVSALLAPFQDGSKLYMPPVLPAVPTVPMFDVNAVVSWASSLDDVYKDASSMAKFVQEQRSEVPFSAALDVDCSTARLLTITACLLNHFFQHQVLQTSPSLMQIIEAQLEGHCATSGSWSKTMLQQVAFRPEDLAKLDHRLGILLKKLPSQFFPRLASATPAGLNLRWQQTAEGGHWLFREAPELRRLVQARSCNGDFAVLSLSFQREVHFEPERLRSEAMRTLPPGMAPTTVTLTTMTTVILTTMTTMITTTTMTTTTATTMTTTTATTMTTTTAMTMTTTTTIPTTTTPTTTEGTEGDSGEAADRRIATKYQGEGQLSPSQATMERFFRLCPPGVACFQGLDIKTEDEVTSSLVGKGYDARSARCKGSANTIAWDRTQWTFLSSREQGSAIAVDLAWQGKVHVRFACLRPALEDCGSQNLRDLLRPARALVACADLSSVGGAFAATLVPGLAGLRSAMFEALGSEVSVPLPRAESVRRQKKLQDLWQPSGIFMTGLEPVAALSEHSEGLGIAGSCQESLEEVRRAGICVCRQATWRRCQTRMHGRPSQEGRSLCWPSSSLRSTSEAKVGRALRPFARARVLTIPHRVASEIATRARNSGSSKRSTGRVSSEQKLTDIVVSSDLCSNLSLQNLTVSPLVREPTVYQSQHETQRHLNIEGLEE